MVAEVLILCWFNDQIYKKKFNETFKKIVSLCHQGLGAVCRADSNDQPVVTFVTSVSFMLLVMLFIYNNF